MWKWCGQPVGDSVTAFTETREMFQCQRKNNFVYLTESNWPADKNIRTWPVNYDYTMQDIIKMVKRGEGVPEVSL